MNTVMLPSDITNKTTSKEGDNSKKCKSYEEQNVHCILPEGAHRAHKVPHIEGGGWKHTLPEETEHKCKQKMERD